MALGPMVACSRGSLGTAPFGTRAPRALFSLIWAPKKPGNQSVLQPSCFLQCHSSIMDTGCSTIVIIVKQDSLTILDNLELELVVNQSRIQGWGSSPVLPPVIRFVPAALASAPKTHSRINLDIGPATSAGRMRLLHDDSSCSCNCSCRSRYRHCVP